VFITGAMDGFTRGRGATTKWRATECSSGRMVAATRASTLTTRRRVAELSCGPTVASTKVSGAMASRTELELTPPRVAKPRWASGRKANALPGSDLLKR
jgi:hypothetical protein